MTIHERHSQLIDLVVTETDPVRHGVAVIVLESWRLGVFYAGGTLEIELSALKETEVKLAPAPISEHLKDALAEKITAETVEAAV